MFLRTRRDRLPPAIALPTAGGMTGDESPTRHARHAVPLFKISDCTRESSIAIVDGRMSGLRSPFGVGAKSTQRCVPKSPQRVRALLASAALLWSPRSGRGLRSAILDLRGVTASCRRLTNRPNRPKPAGFSTAGSSEFRSESAHAGFPVQPLRFGWMRLACQESS
jgi:hypothetical protein